MKSTLLLLLAFLSAVLFSQTIKTLNVSGKERKAIIFEPTLDQSKKPLVFVFHGHGGTAKHASRNMDFQNFYKEAIVVFMEGIPGRTSKLVDPEGKMNGWQHFPNDLQKRDVLFFDEMLAYLQKKYRIDESKIFAVGHSNGARFVNVLWVERAEKLAAICSVAAQGGLMTMGAKPISVWMSMGKDDPLVPYENQAKSIEIVKRNLKVKTENALVQGDKTFYDGEENTELVVEDRNAGHEFPKESIPEMVAFFKRQNKMKSHYTEK